MQQLNLKLAVQISAFMFALKSLVHPDAAAVIVFAILMCCVFVLEFFSAKSVEAKALSKLESLETQVKDLTSIQKQMALAQGMKNNRLGIGNDL